jgi:nucleoside-diphosphate-sugar epimerase
MVKTGVVLLPGDGTQVASYVHVDDLVQAILKAAFFPQAAGKTYFVASEDADWLRLTALISEALGRRPLTLKIPLPLVKLAAIGWEVVGHLRGQAAILNRDKVKEAAPEAWTCDSSKIKRELSWRPKWLLKDGIKQAAESYLKAGWL